MTTPRTEAGLAARITAVVDRLNDSVPGPQSHPESGELLRIAIEAEAAAPYRKALERLVDAINRDESVASNEQEINEALDKAEELLRREVGE